MSVAYCRRRRAGISAQAVTEERLTNWKPPFFPKHTNERHRILETIEKLAVLFGHLKYADKMRVVDAMFRVDVQAGTAVITQGDEGDNFYIVESGVFDYIVARNGNEPVKVGAATAGSAFGELALMYNAPRAATVLALKDSVLWALDHDTFQLMLVTSENTKKRTYEDFLENITIFKGLNKYERVQLSDMLVPGVYKPGEAIIRQNEYGDRFFIVEEGEADCVVRDGDAELIVCHYQRGGYFGELALTGDGVRRATVYAVTRCRVLSICKATFDRVLGPIREIFAKNLDVYREVLDAEQTRWLERCAFRREDQVTVD